MRVFLSGPMRGRPRLNFDAFAADAAILRREGHEVVDPTEIFLALGIDPENPPEMDRAFIAECLINTIRHLATCDTIRMLPGWKDSSGARTEYAAAQAMGLRIMEL